MVKNLERLEIVSFWIPAKAGIQEYTGCRIKSGMTEVVYLIAGLIMLCLMSFELKRLSIIR